MTTQEFLTANLLAAGKSVIGSPVKMSIAENVALSAIDALGIDEFLIQFDEFDEARRVDAVKGDAVVAYIHVETHTNLLKEVNTLLTSGEINSAISIMERLNIS